MVIYKYKKNVEDRYYYTIILEKTEKGYYLALFENKRELLFYEIESFILITDILKELIKFLDYKVKIEQCLFDKIDGILGV